jgi:RNA-directed DNA polymerase
MNYSTYEKKFRGKAIDAGYTEDKIQLCLNYAKKLIENDYPVIYNSSHLSALVGYKRSYIKRAIYFTDYFYRSFQISKKNGKKREIKEPLPSLKEIQQWILNFILYKVTVSKFAKAYIPNRKITDNVRFHKNQEQVICLDIKNFFPSIKATSIQNIFLNIGYSSRVAKILTNLSCLNGSLPQGAPTSPQLSNIYLYKFDKAISKYCIETKIRYTRYADDLAFSGKIEEEKLMTLVNQQLKELGLSLNDNKTKIMTQNMRQVVTGIVVNEKAQVPKEKRKELRQAIFYIEKYGLDSHLEKINCKKANYVKHLLGLVNYVLFINPNDMEAKKQKAFLLSIEKSTVAINVYKK